MAIEDDLFNMLRYGKLTDSKMLLELITGMIASMELQMLKGMRAQINGQISSLQKRQPSMPGELNPFKILDVDMNSTKEEVDRAYREKSWQHHPDQGGSNDDMVKVNAAYEAIKVFRGWK